MRTPRSQIFGCDLVSSGARDALHELIADDQLPAFLGGACRCEGGCVPAAEVWAAAVEATPAVGLTAGAARAVAVARARSTARLLARTIAEIRPACREQLAPFLDDETPRYGGL